MLDVAIFHKKKNTQENPKYTKTCMYNVHDRLDKLLKLKQLLIKQVFLPFTKTEMGSLGIYGNHLSSKNGTNLIKYPQYFGESVSNSG